MSEATQEVVETTLTETAPAVEVSTSPPPESKPEDVAATLFSTYLPVFKNLTATMPKKALLRFIHKLVEYPLQDGDLEFKSKLEQNVFLIGDRLLSSKYLMIMHTYNESMKKKQEEENKNEEVSNETSGEGTPVG